MELPVQTFSAEQIVVPSVLPDILKQYSKAVIRENPKNIADFSCKYFSDKLTELKRREEDEG